MTKLIIFQATGEVRRAKPGEFAGEPDGSIKLFWLKSISEHPIYSRHEIEPTPDVLRALGMEGKDV